MTMSQQTIARTARLATEKRLSANPQTRPGRRRERAVNARECEREARRIVPMIANCYPFPDWKPEWGTKRPKCLRLWNHLVLPHRVEFVCPSYSCCLAALRQWSKERRPRSAGRGKRGAR